MGFSSLRFIQFRNLKNGELELGEMVKNVFLIGENGQGKTNILESIYLLCFGSSFRTKNEKNFPLKGETGCSVKGYYRGPSGFLDLFIKFQNEKKEIFVNGQLTKDRREIIQNVPCLAFVHDDFLFVQGPPERQRLFFDQTLSLYDKEYMSNLLNYRKILKTRNLLLKTADSLTLDVYEEQLVQLGLKLLLKRKEAILDFNLEFSKLFEKISGIKGIFTIKYNPSWKEESKETILTHLKNKREQDRILGNTTSGPHRDRFKFMLDEKNFSETASTGQIRLISLILRVTQGIFYQKMTGKKPLFLLDDVLLELDSKRRKLFLSSLPEYDQAFFTFLPDEPGLEIHGNNSAVFLVENGEVRKFVG